MNPGKLLSPRHSPSCGPLKQQQLGDQDERHPGPRRASEQKRAMAARIAASSFSSAPSSPRLERRGAPGSKREPTTEEVRPARTSSPRFLLVLKSRAAALFDRGCSKIGTSRSFAGRSHALFETCCGGGLWLLVRASGGTRWTEAILKCFSGPFCPRSHRCCASTLAIRNARQPSSAFCCALAGWWLGRCGVAGAPGAHLQGGQGPNVGRGAVYTGIFGDTLATYAPIPAVFFLFPCSFRRQAGPWLCLAQARLMGSHPHQGPAIAGHTSKEQRKTGRDPIAMSVGLAVIAAAGTKGAFFPTPPLQGGLVN